MGGWLLVLPLLGAAPFEQPPIRYSHTLAKDAVTRLVEERVTYSGNDQTILQQVLQTLKVPAASELQVFSKTSQQALIIGPERARQIYFSDSIYVGYVPGGLIEVADFDAKLGPVFYSFDPDEARHAQRTFVRERTCLRCHGSEFGNEFPRLLERSVATDPTGEPLPDQGAALVDDTTPFAQRWGGWRVSGYTGAEATRGKPAATGSDIVALLVFQHQLGMHDSLTRAEQRFLRTGDTAAAADVVDHLLFRNAAPLPDKIGGSPAFRSAFLADAKRDAAGDSLKDLSLNGRLFKNRCSYLIYSDSFQHLSPPLKQAVESRLAQALTGTDPRYAYLEPAERARISEILAATHAP